MKTNNMKDTGIEYETNLTVGKSEVTTIDEILVDSTTKNKKRGSVYFNRMAEALNRSNNTVAQDPEQFTCDYYVDIVYDHCGVPTNYLDGNGIVPECLATIDLIHVDKDGNKNTIFVSSPISAVALDGHRSVVNSLLFQAIFWYGNMPDCTAPHMHRCAVVKACHDIQRVLYAWQGYNNPTGNPLFEDESHNDYFQYSETGFDHSDIKRNTWYSLPINDRLGEGLYEIKHHGYTVQLKRQLVAVKGTAATPILTGLDPVQIKTGGGTIKAFNDVSITHTTKPATLYHINTRWTFVKKTNNGTYDTEEKYLISEKTGINEMPMDLKQVLEVFEEKYMK